MGNNSGILVITPRQNVRHLCVTNIQAASRHMELSLGGLRGFGVVLCSYLTALNRLEELRWLAVKLTCVINVEILSVTELLTQLFFSLHIFHCTRSLALMQIRAGITWSLDFKASGNWISTAPSLTKSLWIPLWPVGPCLEGKITHLSGKRFHMDTKSGAHSCGNESRSFNLRDIINKW